MERRFAADWTNEAAALRGRRREGAEWSPQTADRRRGGSFPLQGLPKGRLAEAADPAVNERDGARTRYLHAIVIGPVLDLQRHVVGELLLGGLHS